MHHIKRPVLQVEAVIGLRRPISTATLIRRATVCQKFSGGYRPDLIRLMFGWVTPYTRFRIYNSLLYQSLYSLCLRDVDTVESWCRKTLDFPWQTKGGRSAVGTHCYEFVNNDEVARLSEFHQRPMSPAKAGTRVSKMAPVFTLSSSWWLRNPIGRVPSLILFYQLS